MSYGRLGKGSPLANTDTTICTISANCIYAEVSISIVNPNVTDAVAQIAIATTGTPGLTEYIEKGAIIPANGGVLIRASELCSPGENIVIRSTLANTVVRVTGKEITSA